MDFINTISRWGKSFVDIIFPNVCTVCHRTLVNGEKYLCLGCLMDMPLTNFHTAVSNSLTDRLFSRTVPIEKTASMFYYRRGNPYTSLIHDTKYRGRPDVGRYLAELHAEGLMSAGFFGDIDLLVPVPLHFLKQLKRGYNQAERIADGIASVSGLPVVTPLRALWHRSQTRKDAHARFRNAAGAYSLRSAADIENKHILLIDDVITTGSTILACAAAVKASSPTTRISVYSLAATYLD